MSRLKDHFIEQAELLASHYEDEGMDPTDAYERAGAEAYDRLSLTLRDGAPASTHPASQAHNTATSLDGDQG